MTGASGPRSWAKESVAPVLRASPPIHYREIQRNRGPIGSLKLHGEGEVAITYSNFDLQQALLLQQIHPIALVNGI